jgi:hypothetical protein
MEVPLLKDALRAAVPSASRRCGVGRSDGEAVPSFRGLRERRAPGGAERWKWRRALPADLTARRDGRGAFARMGRLGSCTKLDGCPRGSLFARRLTRRARSRGRAAVSAIAASPPARAWRTYWNGLFGLLRDLARILIRDLRVVRLRGTVHALASRAGALDTRRGESCEFELVTN